MQTNAAPKSVRWLVIAASVFLIAGLALSGFNAYMAFAAPLQQTYAGPTMVGFEGYLTDAGGTPQDGTFDLTFRLYDVDTGGAALWTEPHSGVPVTEGLYSVLLGETVPLGPGDFSGARWLGIEVNSAGEMTPRIPISAVPWALNASGLTGHPVAAAAPQVGEALVWDGSAWAPGEPGSTLPTSAFIMGEVFKVNGGSGTLKRSPASSQIYGVVFWNLSGEAGDELEAAEAFAIRAGTYTLSLRMTNQNNTGMVDVYIKHTSDTSYTEVTSTPFNTYSASTVYNVVYSVPGVSFPKDGLYSIMLKADDKDQSSSGYYIVFTNIWIN